jgi:hypothetical protein
MAMKLLVSDCVRVQVDLKTRAPLAIADRATSSGLDLQQGCHDLTGVSAGAPREISRQRPTHPSPSPVNKTHAE